MKYNISARLAWIPVVLIALLFSCRKDELPAPKVVPRSADQQLKDSLYCYFQKYSLWSNAATADPAMVAAFTDNYQTPEAVLNALKDMTPIYPGYNAAIDRFSYLEQGADDGLRAAASREAGAGFGLFLSIGAVTDKLAYPLAYFVEGGSPADAAGIRRGDVILGINDTPDLSMPVKCAATGCQVTNGSQQSIVNKLLSAMEQSTMRIHLRRPDGTETWVNLRATHYEINPLLADKVFSVQGKQIGYLALSSFEDITETKPNRYRLDQVFETFSNRNISALILDLRYNTGGYITSATYIANKVAPPAADQSLMFSYALNGYLSKRENWNGENFDDVHFNRNGKLQLKTVYFLVTDITASASELLINVLRPYLNVVIIAEHNGTYGKPVGFFKQEIMGKAALWAASFKLINSRGESDYWDGIAADQRNVADDIFRDLVIRRKV